MAAEKITADVREANQSVTPGQGAEGFLSLPVVLGVMGLFFEALEHLHDDLAQFLRRVVHDREVVFGHFGPGVAEHRACGASHSSNVRQRVSLFDQRIFGRNRSSELYTGRVLETQFVKTHGTPKVVGKWDSPEATPI